jgi:hypothetical protein
MTIDGSDTRAPPRTATSLAGRTKQKGGSE